MSFSVIFNRGEHWSVIGHNYCISNLLCACPLVAASSSRQAPSYACACEHMNCQGSARRGRWSCNLQVMNNVGKLRLWTTLMPLFAVLVQCSPTTSHKFNVKFKHTSSIQFLLKWLWLLFPPWKTEMYFWFTNYASADTHQIVSVFSARLSWETVTRRPSPMTSWTSRTSPWIPQCRDSLWPHVSTYTVEWNNRERWKSVMEFVCICVKSSQVKWDNP